MNREKYWLQKKNWKNNKNLDDEKDRIDDSENTSSDEGEKHNVEIFNECLDSYSESDTEENLVCTSYIT